MRCSARFNDAAYSELDAGQSSGQRIRFLRRCHQVHVIGHETVTQDAGSVADGIVTQQIEVNVMIAEGREYRLAVLAASVPFSPGDQRRKNNVSVA